MSLAVFYKTVADISFYTAFAAFFGSLAGLDTLLLPAILLLGCIMAAAALLEPLSHAPLLRFLPLLALGLVFLLPIGPAGLLVLLPPAVYCAYMIARRRLAPEYSVCVDNFSLCWKLLPLPLLFGILVQELPRLKAHSLPYVLSFFVASVLLLRTVRHSKAVMASRRFQLFNLLPVCLVGLAALALFSEGFRRAAKAAAAFFYAKLIKPLLLLFSYAFGGIIWLIGKLFHLEGIDTEKPPEISEGLSAKDLFGELEPESHPALEMLGQVLMYLVLLAAAVLFLRWLFRRLTRQVRDNRQPEGIISRYSLEEDIIGEKPLRRLDARTPVMKVRYYYQKLLLLTSAAGGKISAARDSGQYLQEQQRLFPNAAGALEEMRSLYLPARYGGTVSEDAAKRAKTLYREVAKNAQLLAKMRS